ncbi:MAG: hypothetical protein COA95_09250 [Methylophaga sp.]|nr:MAG: hypothetical protein COA95_09250 [Methylophaga sp.]
MAENNANRLRNQAFLEQHERQRLNKLCNRTIDLRGKVAGECQAYQFGGKTHYLDDRAYLLVKQLLKHFDGRYTFGVYESLLKALKSLSSTEDNTPENQPEIILKADRSHIQIIPLDRHFHRQESRIIFATPVKIQREDIVYHGATLDITPSAISVALKRTFALNKGDVVSAEFTELASESDFKLLSKVEYKVLMIEHDELRTRVILLRDRKENTAITQQFELWCEQHNSPAYLDLNNVLFNLACRYYRRIYCRTLTSPKFWLNADSPDDPIAAFQLVPTAESTLLPLAKEGENVDLSLLPFKKIVSEQCDFLLQISDQDIHVAHRANTSQIALLLKHHYSQSLSNILLLSSQKIAIDVSDFETEIACIAEDDSIHAQDLEQRLKDMDLLTSVTDITACFPLFTDGPIIQELGEDNLDNQEKQVNPTDFAHTINRDNQRFLIRTSIKINTPNDTFTTTTSDISIFGLSCNLPGNINLTLGSRITVDFIRWQKQASTLKLTKLVYIVRKCRFWSGETKLGLERERASASNNVNQFFISTIDRNKAKLASDNQDTIISQESRIFGALLTKKLTTIPFYLGVDEENRRILQAIALDSGDKNEALWLALQDLVRMMSERLKPIHNNDSASIHFGLYCYQNNQGVWQLSTDYDFPSKNHKSVFISRALTHEHHYFFHCRLCPIVSTWLENEPDLNQQLVELRNHSPHKVKQIRSVLHGLFATGELTDITDVISATLHE